jgi:prevent-host-death family protein
MNQVPIRELNQQTASVMARVEAGETVEITKQGKVVGRIVPPSSGDFNDLDDLVTAGRLTPPANREPFVMPVGEVDHTSAVSNALIAMRDEERW